LALGGQVFDMLAAVALRHLVNSISGCASGVTTAQSQLIFAAAIYVGYAAASAVLISALTRKAILAVRATVRCEQFNPCPSSLIPAFYAYPFR